MTLKALTVATDRDPSALVYTADENNIEQLKVDFQRRHGYWPRTIKVRSIDQVWD